MFLLVETIIQRKNTFFILYDRFFETIIQKKNTFSVLLFQKSIIVSAAETIIQRKKTFFLSLFQNIDHCFCV